MSETTVVYYTHNQEIPSFEKRIQASILEHKGDLPIISVSQKPIDFGENICVGEQGVNSLNTWRQVLIGCQAAKTRFICLTVNINHCCPRLTELRPNSATSGQAV